MSTCPRCGKWNGAVAAPAGIEPYWCICPPPECNHEIKVADGSTVYGECAKCGRVFRLRHG